ncbi:MAG TPA: decaprenyl-phosphate phosphoribosyltransferase [Solirubrobacteraceae bacterium]
MREAEAAAIVAEPPRESAHLLRSVVPHPARRKQRGPLPAAIVTLRPQQWVKNLLVIAAAGAAGALGHDDVPGRVTVAFVAFCLLSSGIYAINDVRDVHEDRLHPKKRFRPVAAGELSRGAAGAIGAALMAVGLGLCVFISPVLGLVGAGYLALTLSYTMVWRHLLLLDIVAVGGGFVLRAVAGGAAAPVTLSRWFLLVITFAAVFVAAGKRFAELRRTDSEAGAGGPVKRRRVLEGYSETRLRGIMAASLGGAVFSYSVWAFQLPTVDGVPWRLLTIVPFAVCLLRYGRLVVAGAGEAPEEVLFHDRLFQLVGLVWLVLFALGVNAAS